MAIGVVELYKREIWAISDYLFTLYGAFGLTSAQAIRLNVCETYFVLGSHAPGARAEKTPEMWLCQSDFAHPIANFAAHFDLNGDESFYRVVAFAKAAPYFRAYAIPGDSPNAIASRFEREGLSPRYRLIGMESASVNGNPESVVRLVTDSVSITETAEFMVRVFFWKSPDSVKQPLAKLLAYSALAGHEFFQTKDEAGLEAAATLSITGDVAGLYNLCVRPDSRSKGIGSAIVRQLQQECRNRGLRLVLQCDEALVPWYAMLGFSEAAQVIAYAS